VSAYRRRYRDPASGKSLVDPQWRYRRWVTLPDGRKERVTGTPSINTKQAALDAERAHVARVLDPKKTASDLTFSKFWAERWLPAFGKKGAASTIESREDIYENHLQPAIGSVQLGAITKERIDRLVAALEGKGLKTRTVRNCLNVLRRVLRDAVEWDLLPALPRFPKLKPPQVAFDWYRLPEVGQLLAAARDVHDRALLHLACCTGLRAGEILALQWQVIDETAAVVRVQRSRTRQATKSTKSGRHRSIPLTSDLLRDLRAHGGGDRDGLVFHRGGQPLRIGQLQECNWRTAKAAGLRRLKFHGLRHSFASNLVSAGVPIQQV
jgi:integrase